LFWLFGVKIKLDLLVYNGMNIFLLELSKWDTTSTKKNEGTLDVFFFDHHSHLLNDRFELLKFN
jgi:hypothetical protein